MPEVIPTLDSTATLVNEFVVGVSALTANQGLSSERSRSVDKEYTATLGLAHQRKRSLEKQYAVALGLLHERHRLTHRELVAMLGLTSERARSIQRMFLATLGLEHQRNKSVEKFYLAALGLAHVRSRSAERNFLAQLGLGSDSRGRLRRADFEGFLKDKELLNAWSCLWTDRKFAPILLQMFQRINEQFREGSDDIE